MRGTWLAAVAALFAAAWAAGCESAPAPEPAPAPPPPVPAPPPLDVLSADRAWSDLSALAAIGPRLAGSDAAAEARAYLKAQLAVVAADVHEVETVRLRAPMEPPAMEPPDAEPPAGPPEPQHEILTHVVATLPGASPDLFLLVAPYDSSQIEGISFVGVNDGASGAALLLELARVLSTRALPYTTRFVFLEGEGRARGLEGAERWSGSRSLAEAMAARGELAPVRVLLAFNQVCDADLQIARDLGSHRMHREEFFRAALRLGRADAFAVAQDFESVEASHDAFREAGVRGAVALLDTRFGGDQVPGLYAESVDDTLDHCAPGSLETLGEVTLEALRTIGARLAKIDRFSRRPLAPVEAETLDIGGSPDVVPELPETLETGEAVDSGEAAETGETAETSETAETAAEAGEAADPPPTPEADTP